MHIHNGHSRSTVLLTMIFFLCSSTGHAQQDAAGGLQVGPGVLYPSLSTAGFYNDNLLYQPENEVSTLGFRINPAVSYEAGSEIRRFILDWGLQAGFHEASSNDDYVDQSLGLGFEYQPTSRFFSRVEGVYRDAHDPRGTGRAEGVNLPLLPDPDQWHSIGAEGNLAYGAEAATGRLEFDAGFIIKEYDNNRSFTFIRDRNDLYATGRFYYRVGARTSLVAEGRATRYGYDKHVPGIPGLNSQVYRALAGLTWDVTDKTTGFAKGAYIIKDFSAREREDSEAAGWEVGIEWRPRSYSVLNFFTARDFQETNGTGNFIQQDNVDITWKHFWLERFSSEIGFGYAKNKFEPTTREDEVLSARVKWDYHMRRWLTLGAGYRYSKRTSNDDQFDYAGNVFEIMMRIAL